MIKLPALFTVIFMLFWAISCSGPQSTPATSTEPTAANPESDEILRQNRILSRLTDDILVALATYNYSRLERWINPSDQNLTGAQAAVLLIGSHAPTMALGPWDAQQINVRLDDKMLNATTTVYVTYRLSLNREPQTSLFTFHFTRNNPANSWKLVI